MEPTMYIGAHVSAAGGVFHAPGRAAELGATAFALFVKNQKRWSAPPLTEEDIRKFKKECGKFHYGPEQILPHDSYLINLGNPDPEKRKKSLNAFIDEARRCEALGLSYLNFHPGSHLKQVSEEECLSLIAESLKEAAAETEHLIFVIENTAGQGTNLGYKWEHLAQIMEKSGKEDRLGVCIDSCHSFAAGYDLPGQWDKISEGFDRIIGFDKLKGMHLNDSLKTLGSKVDRHRPLGDGEMGKELFSVLVKDSRLKGIPLILETPEPDLWPDEIAFLKKEAGEKDG